MRLTWVDAAEAMLEGARELPEPTHPHFWWEDADGNFTKDRALVVAACAEGCASYAAGEESWNTEDYGSPAFRAAWAELESRYAARFDVEHIYDDNDEHGRDYVLGNVKQLLAEVQR